MYKSVINDVISSIKDIFLDESIDVEVLSQLKTVVVVGMKLFNSSGMGE